MGYVNCESAKEMVRMRLFEKKVVIKSWLSLKVGCSGIVKYRFFLGFFRSNANFWGY